DGIISDNRLGVRYKKIPCVFITHQLNVLSGNTTWMSSKAHQRVIKKFDACWVPDVAGKPNLSGKLGHLKDPRMDLVHMGPLSRLEKMDLPILHDLMVLISGPEPQRGLLEKKLLQELHGFDGNVLLVAGKIEGEQTREEIPLPKGRLIRYNFMTGGQLQPALNQSAKILCRSGYTTVMDLAKLEKKAFFIPTPGQYEQVYLAKRLEKQGLVPYCNQEDFVLGQLKRVEGFQGLAHFAGDVDYASLFALFSKVNENSDPTSTSLST